MVLGGGGVASARHVSDLPVNNAHFTFDAPLGPSVVRWDPKRELIFSMLEGMIGYIQSMLKVWPHARSARCTFSMMFCIACRNDGQREKNLLVTR